MLARPGLPSIEYIRAESAEQVHQLLQEQGTRLMMGGTDLLPQMRDGAVRPKTVVDLKGLAGMRQVTLDADGLSIGAAVTMNQVAQDPNIRETYPTLAQAAGSVASYQIRNRATIGGNLCNASPCADSSPAVLALDGELILHGPKGKRNLRADEFFVGPGKTALAPGEFLEVIRFPRPPAGSAGTYSKLGRNKQGDLAVVGVAVMGWPDTSASSGYRFQIALGSVAPVPFRIPAAEKILSDQPIGESSIAAVAEMAMAAASPISDVRSSARYQILMVKTMVMRAIRAVSTALCEVSE